MMTTKYTVVQFVPELVADERINIGLIAWSDDEVRSAFLNDWDRVRKMAKADIGYVQETAQEIERRTGAQRDAVGYKPLTGAQIQDMVSTWNRHIKFSDVRGSLTKAPEELVRDLKGMFLVEKPEQKSHRKTRKYAISVSYRRICHVTENMLQQDASRYVKQKYKIRGELTTHPFDVGLANGRPIAAVDAVSFEVSHKSVEDILNRIYWDLEDTRKQRQNLDVAVYMIPPKKRTADYEEAKRILSGLNAKVITDVDEIDEWTKRQVNKLENVS